ncbi:MAG: polysaccharide biosynthesis tyrosine autokinase [Christiangramia sp.]|uniref:exopolysaccharide transport family protein n=1 Tax=Christiangramia sp. TaxID=1931228 RepID=UPI003241F74E
MEEIFDYNEQKEESSFDLKAEIYKYLTHWKWLLFSCLLGLTIAYLYNRYTLPKYRSESTLMILSESEGNVSGVLDGASGSLLKLEDNSLENQIVNLKSKRLVKKVIDDLDFNISYFVEGNVITPEVYKNSPVKINFRTADSIVNTSYLNVLISPKSNTQFDLSIGEKQLGSYGFGENIEIENLKFSIESNSAQVKNSNPVHIVVRPVADVAQEYILNSMIYPKGKGMDILTLQTTNNVSDKGEDFLNNLMYQFNFDGVKDKRQVAAKTTEFIQNRLENITVDLDSVETNLADFKKNNQFMDVNAGAGQFMDQRLSAEQELFNIETQLSIINSIKEDIQAESEYEILPENVGVESSNVSNAITNYNQLLLERQSLLSSSTTANPVVKDIENQISSVRKSLQQNIETAIRNLNIEKAGLSQRENLATSKFSTFPGMEKGIRNIERQQQIKEQLYLFLLQRREEAAIAFAVTSPVAKVIDSAYTYPSPISPQPWLILLGGFIIGLIIPILIIFVKNFLDTKVHHKVDLNPLIKEVPFMGEVPRIGQDQSDVIQLNDRSPLAESFRILRTNLAYLIQKKDKGVADIIFVTSTVKGEGKTFVSYNLARTLATTNKRVLLIGADIRNPKLHRYTSATIGAREKGLSDYLYDYEVTKEDIISKTNDEGIAVNVILSGPIPPNPAELLMNDRMENLIETCKPEYDYIIVDTAPTMIVTDTLLISQQADYTLYVTRADYTEKNLLQFPKDLKKQGKLKGLAVILNDVDYSKFSYGAQYGYSYGYGYGYGADEESRLQRLKKRLFTKSK